MSDTNFGYSFPAIRGVQAGREFYVTQFPLSLISRVLSFDDSDLPAELRAQRSLSSQRIPEMVQYVVENRHDYVFSALTASIDADVLFEPITEGSSQELGVLRIPMKARFVVNDGQHRRAAIKEALDIDPSLRDESIGMVLFVDRGLERCQQMFADLNRYAVRPSSSIGILYDHRDPLASVTRSVIARLDWLRDVVELEKTTLTPRSRKLFTLSALFSGTRALLMGIDLTVEEQVLIGCAFWDGIATGFPDWKMVHTKRSSSAEIRETYIYSHALALHAIGLAGNALLVKGDPVDWNEIGKKLGSIDWRKSNAKLWEGRALVGGRVQKGSQNVILTTNVLKKAVGIPLTKEEKTLETAVARRS
jgi:DNA sulfur modification protein DndB